MKILFRILMLLVFINPFNSNAQDAEITIDYKEKAIFRLIDLMNDYYVSPDVAKSTEVHLRKELKNGHFEKFKDDLSFAEALTTAVQFINKDKHMRIQVNPAFEEAVNSPERMVEERFYQINRSRNFNSGLNTVKILEGNVGYLDLRGFAGMESGKEIADAYMRLMSRSDAVIVDLTKNGGGSPAMVQYLCSYFFDKVVHLNSLYWRDGDRTQEFWSLEKVGGEKMPDVPLFVIISNKTFSGAEEFSYNLQTQNRAILVGQTSGGGANPGGTMPVNENLSVFIPSGKAINPITNTNWEGVGVVPNIKTSPEDAFDKTYELAKQAAESFRSKAKSKYQQAFNQLLAVLEKHDGDTSDEAILKQLKKCVEEEVMNEGDINMLGYQYLMEHKKPQIALSIFMANTKLFPNSANVYDSYAESLMMQGKLDLSLQNYEKAVEVATKNEDRDLELFTQNLENLKEQLKSKKN